MKINMTSLSSYLHQYLNRSDHQVKLYHLYVRIYQGNTQDHANVMENFARANINIGLYLVTVVTLYLLALTFLLLNHWR